MSGYLGRPGATAAAVVGQPDEHWGEIVVAFVTAAPGAVVEQESLRSFCRERLAAYKVPAVVTVIRDGYRLLRLPLLPLVAATAT